MSAGTVGIGVCPTSPGREASFIHLKAPVEHDQTSLHAHSPHVSLDETGPPPTRPFPFCATLPLSTRGARSVLRGRGGSGLPQRRSGPGGPATPFATSQAYAELAERAAKARTMSELDRSRPRRRWHWLRSTTTTPGAKIRTFGSAIRTPSDARGEFPTRIV
jgi:hypothetical protein